MDGVETLSSDCLHEYGRTALKDNPLVQAPDGSIQFERVDMKPWLRALRTRSCAKYPDIDLSLSEPVEAPTLKKIQRVVIQIHNLLVILQSTRPLVCLPCPNDDIWLGARGKPDDRVARLLHLQLHTEEINYLLK